MNLRQFLSMIQARSGPALLIYLLTVSTAVGVGLWMPRQYTATATLVVDQNRPDPVAGARYGATLPSFVAKQVDILKSDRVGQRVVKMLGLADEPASRAEWLRVTDGVGSFEAWRVAGLQFFLDVKPSRESNVISVSYVARDPVRAANVANAFVRAYLDVLLELKVDPARQYASSFDARSKKQRVALEQAQAKLSAYQRENGVTVISDRQLDAETTRLNRLSTQLSVLQAVSAESSSRQRQALSGAGDQLHEVVNNPALADLRRDLTRAEARLQELSARLGESHPLVIEARANVASLQTQVDAETRRVTSSLGLADSINRQRETEIRVALEAQRARVLSLRSTREEGVVLLREVEAAQRAYDAVVAKLNQSSLEGLTTQSDAYVLASAMPPYAPSSPNMLLNTSLSIVAGLVLAVVAAMLLELVDRRVRTVDEVSGLLGLPLLGVLPPEGGKGRFVSHRTPLVLPRKLFRGPSAPRKGT
jgi:chain length determinant protein EpsF